MVHPGRRRLHLQSMTSKLTSLEPAEKQALAGALNRLLADEYILYTKTRNFHWNVTGPHFHDYHLLFEKQYQELDAIIDEVAEFVRSLGGEALGSLRAFLDVARLPEASGEAGAPAMVRQLLDDHEALIRTLRSDIETAVAANDAAAADLLTRILGRHLKTAWMLRATLGA